MTTQAKLSEEGAADAGEVVEAEVLEVEVLGQPRQLPAVQSFEAMVARAEISPDDVVAQREKIKQVVALVMDEGVHFGTIPGVNKPSLFKPGAEVLLVTFRLAPSYQSEKAYEGPHLTVTTKCVLTHIPTGLVLGEGEGLCTTRESRYAYRQGIRVCPNCGADAIKKSKFPPREGDYLGADPADPPGWYCFAKVGGCGLNFAANEPLIVDQEIGRSENPDIPDLWNTVLKMGAKRALVAAILNVTAASDVFTQDVEDGSSQPDAAETQQEAAGGRVKLPQSWAEWKERMASLGVPERDQGHWLAGAAPLSATVKWAKARRLLVILAERVGPDFATSPRGILRAWIAEAFDGMAAEGPPYRIADSEVDRPTFEEWDAEQAAAIQAGEAGVYQVDPDIEF